MILVLFQVVQRPCKVMRKWKLISITHNKIALKVVQKQKQNYFYFLQIEVNVKFSKFSIKLTIIMQVWEKVKIYVSKYFEI